jgi:KTSC domain
MERQPVKSSSIKSIGYDEALRALEVEFLNGGVYQHIGVPPEIYRLFINSDSLGKQYARLLRGRFKCVKVASIRARDTAPDWDGKCENCGASPIVPLTGMCGPCTFGEADTAGGNW